MTVEEVCLYPVFLELMSHSDDDNFCRLMESFAAGKTSKGVKMSSTIEDETELITITTHKKSIVIDTSESSETNYENLATYLLKTKLYHPNDDSKDRNSIESLENIEWVKIKSQKVKQCMIQQFVSQLKNKNNLNDTQMMHLYNFINLYIYTKKCVKDIIVINNVITNINGIPYESLW